MPVRKAEESARKVLHDLFSGGPGGASSTGGVPLSSERGGYARPACSAARSASASGSAAGRPRAANQAATFRASLAR